MSRSTSTNRRADRSAPAGAASPGGSRILHAVQSMLRNRRERRLFLLLTIPALVIQYFFWSWMDWSAIIMLP
ncbi:MAG TPA: hypothetical protein VHL98_18865 [Microvirga sp.]|nr:hypothetical protein [Microvirga sp.]